jgi:hypothetical protein
VICSGSNHPLHGTVARGMLEGEETGYGYIFRPVGMSLIPERRGIFPQYARLFSGQFLLKHTQPFFCEIKHGQYIIMRRDIKLLLMI